MAKGYEEPEEFEEIVPGVTWGEAKGWLPKVDLEKILTMKSEGIVDAMRDYVIARMHLEYVAGNPNVQGAIAKLHVDPITARSKISLILGEAKKGKPAAGLTYEGPKGEAESILSRALSGGVHLPEGDFEGGMRNLKEVPSA